MATKTSLSSICRSCRHKIISNRPQQRTISSSPSSFAQDAPNNAFSQYNNTSSSSPSRPARRFQSEQQYDLRDPQEIATDTFQKSLRPQTQQDRPAAQVLSTARSSSTTDRIWATASGEASTRPGGGVPQDEPYHLNIYAHKHNMHITFTEPSRNVILSYSCGDIGLKKAQRGTYDAAYQLSTYTMRKMAEKQWRQGGKKMAQNAMRTLRDVRGGAMAGHGIEVVLRGYGQGREAFQKALLGTEGTFVKPLIVKVTDSTRLKFGGTRSPQVRRLG